MCAVSNSMDGFRDNFFPKSPWANPPSNPLVWPLPATPNGPSRREFDALKNELEALKDLLRAAKIYDEKTNQPDCEMAEKVDWLKKMAEYLGVDLEDVLTYTAK